nr:MAG TPA: Repressor protein CI [Bacteriophage sp.]DAQ98101.1 MAG TPA: Repressor protein CI [Caudoviricetes sp.]
MYEIYQKLLDMNGVKSADVARATGISNMTFSDWKNGKSTPKMDKIEKIAKYFGVTTDYMMGKKSEVPSASMADDHLELIKLYSSLSEADQKAIMQIMRSMAK